MHTRFAVTPNPLCAFGNALRRCTRCFGRDEHAVTAIKFAIVSPMVVFLLLGTVENGLDLWVDATVETAVQRASRLGITTLPPTGETMQQAISDSIKTTMSVWMSRATTFSVVSKVYPSYVGSAGAEPYTDVGNVGHYVKSDPFVDVNKNGVWDADLGVNGTGNYDDVVSLHRHDHDEQLYRYSRTVRDSQSELHLHVRRAERTFPMMRSLIRRGRQRVARLRVKRFWQSDHGVAGIETAVIVPLALLIMLGFTELYLYLRTVSAAERVAFTLADTIGQKASIVDVNTTASANNIGTYWYATTAISQPLDFQSHGEVIITSICDTVSDNCHDPQAIGSVGSTGTLALLWQRRSPNNGANSPNQNSRLPAGLKPGAWPFFSGDSMIAVEVFYQFNPYLMTSAFWADAPGVVTVY
ncbi:MAG: hypothetical protein CPDRYMAC_1693 [uncultured Paraburkholderia sp.]|nr:MAG: hypothetical protein CPDRYDRY_1664 [uncultured Paraburkholderia sp.]CAH2919899.1 MAG: hypothetical protein CPDRYMAC_1693 [uncultured Paraburkholderia sp.]